jgi:glycosyltransferase involved in cell wall biosynthesis
MSPAGKTVLWWGRFDPDYSRNRVLRQAYRELGWQLIDFHPWGPGAIGDVEARLRGTPATDLIHVPCFRQRDMAAAARYARRQRVPLLFDPLISAYDKQVYERRKLSPCGLAARRLLRHEQRLFTGADIVLADTPEHQRFFAETLLVENQKLHVVYVGAEQPLFTPGPARAPNQPLEILFYGSFIALQGAELIVEAARAYHGPPAQWVLLGDGPLREQCRRSATGLRHVTFENWLPYPELPDRIRRADILLGVFGDTHKALRVIPNKVFQALACGRPLVTGVAPAYPAELTAASDSGITWVPMGDAREIALAVAGLAAHPERLAESGARARVSYDKWFAPEKIRAQLAEALAGLA